MNRTPWTDKNSGGATPLELELNTLRDENRRLKGLLELREDRSELDKFQVQSRNKLLLLMVFTIVTLGGSWIYYLASEHQLQQENQQQKETIYKYKHATVYVPSQ